MECIRNLPPTLDGWVQQLVTLDQPQLLVPHWRFPKQSLLPLHFPWSTLHLFKLLQQESVLEWLNPQEKGSWQHFVPLHRFSSLLEFGSQMRPSRHWESFWHGPSLSPQSSFFVQSQPIWFLQSAWKIIFNMNSYNDQHCGLLGQEMPSEKVSPQLFCPQIKSKTLGINVAESFIENAFFILSEVTAWVILKDWLNAIINDEMSFWVKKVIIL